MVVLPTISESIVLNSIICLILTIATISNSLLLLVFHRRPGLRTISNRFVINLLVTNLITCWTLLPLLLFDNIWRKTEFRLDLLTGYNVPLCAISEGLAIGLCEATVLSVLLIGIDQYFAVIDPLRYHSSINATTSAIMIAVSWTIATIFGLFGSLSISKHSTWFPCENLQDEVLLPALYRVLFTVIYAAFAFIVPFASVCWIYLSICSAAHENNLRTKRNGSSISNIVEAPPLDYTIVSTIHESVEYDANNDPRTPITPVPLIDQPKPFHHSSTKSSLKSTSSSIVNSLRHRISNASMFRYREETRAARISVLVIVMALFCWLPFTLIMLLNSSLHEDVLLPYYLRQIGILSLTANAVVSPLIFAHRNRRVHRELCKLFRASKKRTSFYDNISTVKRNHSINRRLFLQNADAKNKDLLVSLTGSNTVGDANSDAVPTIIDTAQVGKTPKKSVSIMTRVWSCRSNKLQKSFNLPEVALETDTSRSSFSSNASSCSNHRSTSAASISDIIEEI